MEMEGGRQKVVMSKLKESLLFRLAAFNPSLSINSAHSSFIEDRLQQLFNSFHTPTHPPYPLMIKRAIMELNEGSGSTEEAISEFIRRKYEGLPYAHASILDIHLRRLCLDGDIVCTKNGRYVLLVDCDKGVIGRRMLEGDEDNVMQDQEIVEQGLVSELHSAGTNVPNRVVGLGDWTETEVHWQSTERVDEKQGKSEKSLLGEVELCQGSAVYTEDHSEADNYKVQMAKAPSEAQEQQIRVLCSCGIQNSEQV